MAGIGDDFEVCFWPGPVEFPRAHDGADNVVTALDDHAGNVSNLVDIVDQEVIGIEEDVVDEVVTLDPGQGECCVRLPIMLYQVLIGK